MPDDGEKYGDEIYDDRDMDNDTEYANVLSSDRLMPLKLLLIVVVCNVGICHTCRTLLLLYMHYSRGRDQTFISGNTGCHYLFLW